MAMLAENQKLMPRPGEQPLETEAAQTADKLTPFDGMPSGHSRVG